MAGSRLERAIGIQAARPREPKESHSNGGGEADEAYELILSHQETRAAADSTVWAAAVGFCCPLIINSPCPGQVRYQAPVVEVR
jgi:hypothetical protein